MPRFWRTVSAHGRCPVHRRRRRARHLFDDDGRLLVEETVEHAVDLVERGIAAVVVSGTTGESWALDVDERLELCAAAADALDGLAPVIVGSGHLDDDGAARLVGSAADAGAAAVLALSPPHSDDVRPHYEALAGRAGGLRCSPTTSRPSRRPASRSRSSTSCRSRSEGLLGRRRAPRRRAGRLRRSALRRLVGLPALAGPLGATARSSLANTDPEGCIAALAGDMEAQRALLPGHRSRASTSRPASSAGSRARRASPPCAR
jgi:hypothetical protein